MSSPEPVPSPLPPGLSPNGHGPMTQAVQQVAALVEQLPQMLFQAAAAALAQQAVTVRQLHCATCRSERLQWGALHQAEIAEADQAWRAAAAEMEARDPQDRVPVDPASFIPEHLRQGAPGINDATVMVGGTLLCDGHIPGVQQAPGRKEFLIANAPLSSALIAEVMGQRAA